jgi:Flp pilus assembly protein TadD
LESRDLLQQNGLMSKGKANVLAISGGALLLISLLAAYANHFQNSFHFDDAHTIENNASIRELRNIPLFFRDATTFSSLPSNQSYRPLVSTLLAIAYWLGGGLKPFWFHFSVFGLFVALTLLLAFVVYRLLGRGGEFAQNSGLIALIAAACYGLHPANADAVNYIIASSEVIAALGVIASFAFYFFFPTLRRYHLYVLPAAIAILAKPPAAIFAVVFAIYLLLFRDETMPEKSRTRKACSYFARVTPAFLICAATLLFVRHMTPRSWIAGAANAHNYLITQPYVALLYLKTFFWPDSLSADYDLNPFATADDPRFRAGFVFIALFTTAAIVFSVFKKTRVIGFGLVWFLVTLLSTSLLPLAEVMNDHRTFLPYIGLVIAMAGAASLLMNRRISYGIWARIAAGCAVALLLCVSGYGTFQRNQVWKSEETLWRDVVTKSPLNGRGWMNYGNTLMAKGEYKEALDCFHRAQVLTPHYPVLLINLAIAEDATKQGASAEQHFREALRLAPSSPDSYTYYSRYLLSHAQAQQARELLRAAIDLSPRDLAARDLLNRAESEAAREPMTHPAEFYLDLSLRLYREQRYVESIVACRLALALRPNYAEAWNNIGAADNKLHRFEEAAAACEQALQAKPDFELARNNLKYAREMEKAPAK